MLKVLIVDDYAIVRRGLREILHESAGPALQTVKVGEASHGHEALELVRKEPWDLVIPDITLPDLSGLSVLKQIKRERPQLPVLMLSMHFSREYVLSSLNFGASGYLSKESIPEELLTALVTVLGGGRYVSQSLAREFQLDLS
jgi:DNA-binding NarL/FixJ family response regulator